MSTSAESLCDWLARRAPAPPPALGEGLHVAVGAALDAPAAELPERLLSVGERSLASLLALDTLARDAALRLLVADALVTYAFEAAAETRLELESFADAAMSRLSAHGTHAEVGR